VERAADILCVLSNGNDSMGVTEIAGVVGLSKGTVHRLLQSLVKKGFVSSYGNRQTYRLGGQVLLLGLKMQEHLPIRSECRPFLFELREITGETSILFIAIGEQAVPVEQAITRLEPKPVARIGHPEALHAGAYGKALLAFHSDEFIDEYLKRTQLEAVTEKTITEPQRLRRDLMAVRERGYAISSGEKRKNANGLAFPLLNMEGRILGVIDIAGPSERWTLARIEESIAKCQTVVESLSLRLRYMEPLSL
jgi:DNA-binding IclR family transcriptional regulator